MENFEYLAENLHFADKLLNDEDFVKKAKDIFSEFDMDINNEQLRTLITKIEESFKHDENLLDDNKLKNISGGNVGINFKKIKIDKAVIIKATSTTLSAVLGNTAGLFGGAFISEAIAEHTDSIKYNFNKRANISNATGAITGIFTGTGMGILGYKLGNLICKKAGLEK